MTGCTVEAYAAAKKLPEDFLRECGLEDYSKRYRPPAIKIPYYDPDGELAATRFRLALSSESNRFRWRMGATPVPYGLWKLAEAREAAGERCGDGILAHPGHFHQSVPEQHPCGVEHVRLDAMIGLVERLA